MAIPTFFPVKCGEFADFFPRNSLCRSRSLFFSSPSRKISSPKKKKQRWSGYSMQKSIRVQHGAYFPAFNLVPSLVKPQYRVKPALCNGRGTRVPPVLPFAIRTTYKSLAVFLYPSRTTPLAFSQSPLTSRISSCSQLSFRSFLLYRPFTTTHLLHSS